MFSIVAVALVNNVGSSVIGLSTPLTDLGDYNDLGYPIDTTLSKLKELCLMRVTHRCTVLENGAEAS